MCDVWHVKSLINVIAKDKHLKVYSYERQCLQFTIHTFFSDMYSKLVTQKMWIEHHCIRY